MEHLTPVPFFEISKNPLEGTLGMVQTGCLFSGKIETVPRSWKNMLSCSELFKVPRKCLAIQKYNGKVEKSIFL